MLRTTVEGADGLAVALATLGAGLAIGLSVDAGAAELPHAYSPLEAPLVLFGAAALFLAARAVGGGGGSSDAPPAAPKLPPAPQWKGSGDVRADFLAVCEDLTKELVAEAEGETPRLPAVVTQHIRRLIDYNVPKGKLNRGITVVEAMEAIKGPSSAELTWRAAALGWCVEWLQVRWFGLLRCKISNTSAPRRLSTMVFPPAPRHRWWIIGPRKVGPGVCGMDGFRKN